MCEGELQVINLLGRGRPDFSRSTRAQFVLNLILFISPCIISLTFMQTNLGLQHSKLRITAVTKPDYSYNSLYLAVFLEG